MDIRELENLVDDMAASARSLAEHLRKSSPDLPLLPLDAPAEVHQARQNMLRNATKIQTLLIEPANIVQNIAIQAQMIACMQWLGDFQILACIPQSGSATFKDIAVLCSVDEVQLSRVIRMTATAGFLHETTPGEVAHTAASALFVSKPSLGDAVMFVAEHAVPAALRMGKSTREVRSSVSQTCEHRPKLKRQWAAYLQHAACCPTGTGHHAAQEVLSQLDWTNLGEACVVDVGACSTQFATALADLHPNLRLVVQISTGESAASKLVPSSLSATATLATSGRVIMQSRAVGALQTVTEAAVYILRLPPAMIAAPLLSQSRLSLTARIAGELRAHLPILAANSRASLIVIPHRMLPEPGTVDVDVEAGARMRDLSLFQLTNERELERSELVEIITATSNDHGRFHVVGELRARNNVLVAVGVKFQPYQLHAKPLQAIF